GLEGGLRRLPQRRVVRQPDQESLTGAAPRTPPPPARARGPARPPTGAAMIDVNRVSRRFQVGRNEHVDALTDVSFSVREGEMAALLGPNGAGKSTVLRVLTALVPPTSGTATVAGYSVVDAPAKVRGAVGFVGQGNGAAHGQRVDDELLAQGRAYGLSRAESRERCAELLELLDLTGVAGRHVRSLSGG